ncbi:MAG: N-acetylmuramoyl-L-alanine amidase family protein [Bacillota bacterium]
MKRAVFIFFLCLLSMVFNPAYVFAGAATGGNTVVVDPGHGGYDPGTVYGGVYEKEINLQIALKLSDLLREKGFNVVMTRIGDYNLAVSGLHAKEANRYDLGKRVEMAGQCNASLFVSIHTNSIRNTRCRGAEVFYNPGAEKSKILAECIQTELHSIDDMVKRTAKASDYYVLRNTTMPSVLIEVGYLSNSGERNKLKNNDYQLLLAEKIVSGIQKFNRAQ